MVGGVLHVHSTQKSPNAKNPAIHVVMPSEVTADLRLNEPRASLRTCRQVTSLQEMFIFGFPKIGTSYFVD